MGKSSWPSAEYGELFSEICKKQHFLCRADKIIDTGYLPGFFLARRRCADRINDDMVVALNLPERCRQPSLRNGIPAAALTIARSLSCRRVQSK